MSKPLSKTPPPVRPSNLRRRLLASTMLTPLEGTGLNEHLFWAALDVSFAE